MMDKFKVGDMVTVYFGIIPMIGPIVHIDKKAQKYLVRFNSAGQQMYYSEDELQPYESKKLKKQFTY